MTAVNRCTTRENSMAPMAKSKNFGSPPILAGGRLENGDVVYEQDFTFGGAAAFEASLAAWLGRYVARASVAILMRDADGLRQIISYLENAPPSMSGKRTIKMYLIWDRLSNKQWYVEAVGFSLHDGMRNIYQANMTALRQRLIEKAQEDALRHPPEWKAYFDISQVSDNYLDDAAEGQRMIDGL